MTGLATDVARQLVKRTGTGTTCPTPTSPAGSGNRPARLRSPAYLKKRPRERLSHPPSSLSFTMFIRLAFTSDT